jgi:hypothetical protein
MQRIIYPNGDGVAVIIPAEKSGLPIEEIARKDVPEGVPYRIVATADIPIDRNVNSGPPISTNLMDMASAPQPGVRSRRQFLPPLTRRNWAWRKANDRHHHSARTATACS